MCWFVSDIHGLGGLGEIANGLIAATSGAFRVHMHADVRFHTITVRLTVAT